MKVLARPSFHGSVNLSHIFDSMSCLIQVCTVCRGLSVQKQYSIEHSDPKNHINFQLEKAMWGVPDIRGKVS